MEEKSLLIVADKAGGRAAYAVRSPSLVGGPGPFTRSPLPWEAGTPMSPAGCGGGVTKCQWDSREKR